ncbi:GP179 protein, partial [Amazona guildingii]|nr:GP179 protein [Amazona guildingii]
ATPKEGLEGPSGSIPSQDHTEMEQPRAGPIANSSHPSISDGQRAAAEELEAEICPQGALDVPAGTVCPEEVVSQEDTGVPPAKVLEKGSSHPEPLGPRDIGKVPARSRSEEMAPVRRKAQVCPRETQADSSIKTGICPWEESRGDPQHPREELGMEKPSTNPSELLERPLEGRRAQVCPWESLEQGRTTGAETCPWDTEGAQEEQGGQEAERRRGCPYPREGAEQRSTGLAGGHPALPKATSKQAGAIGSSKANVCPWEVEDEPLAKTEICPWEEPEAPSGKDRASQDTRGTSKGENKPAARGPEGIKPKLAEVGAHQPE